MVNIVQEIKTKIIKSAKVEFGLDLPESNIILNRSSGEDHGDLATNVSVYISKLVNKPPAEVCFCLARNIKPEISKSLYLESVSNADIFLNFKLKQTFFLYELGNLLNKGDCVTKNKWAEKIKILFEFAHPNTHKIFHVGHLRTLTVGESMSRIYESLGANVKRINYQGDIGLHVAKSLWGIKKILFDSPLELKHLFKKPLSEKLHIMSQAYVLGSSEYENNSSSKEEILKLNKDIYNLSTKETRDLWNETRTWSLEAFDKIYEKFGTHFDRFYFESEVWVRGLKIAKRALKRGILVKSEGAVIFSGEKYGLHSRVFITQEGLPTYEAKELGLAELEFSEFGEISKCVHVVASEQESFFKVTFKVQELLDPKKYKDKQRHLVYGYVNLKGKKMSSRKGVVVMGEEVVNMVFSKVKDIMSNRNLDNPDETALKLTVAAIKYFMLKYSIKKDIVFDINESISLEGNSGPYLVYTFARANSIVNNASIEMQSDKGAWDFSDNLEISLLKWLERFPEVVLIAGKNYSPNVICVYLYELAQRFNAFYQKLPVLTAESAEQKSSRVSLTKAVSIVLKSGLNMLGIETVEKM